MIGILAESFMTASRAEIWRFDPPEPVREPARKGGPRRWRGWRRLVS